MEKLNYKINIAPGPSRALTRGPGENLVQGTSPVKKLPDHLFCYKKYKNIQKNRKINKIRNFDKKYSKCGDTRCQTCPVANKEQIEDGYDPFCKTVDVIYYIECLSCGMGYVGQTSNHLNIRLNGHRSDVNNFGKHNKYDFELEHFQKHSFSKIEITILEVKHELSERLDLENLYICKQKTLYPYGLNTKFNGNCNFENNSSIYGKFRVFEDFARHGVKIRGKRGSKIMKFESDLVKLFREFNQGEISSCLIRFIKQGIFMTKNKALNWFIKDKLGAIKFKDKQVKEVIIDLIKFKLKKDNLYSNTELKNENLVISFLNKKYDHLGFRDIISNNENSFPLKKHCKVRIAFKYEKPLRNIICNYNYYSKNLQELSEDDCVCEQEKLSEFKNEFYGHIITGNLNIIENPELRKLMLFGSKFRAEKFLSYNKSVDIFVKELNIFIVKIAKIYSWPFEGFMEWKLKVIADFKLHLKGLFENWKDNLTQDSYTINKKLRDEIKYLKSQFIITVVDKSDGNFCIMCKSLYKKLLLNEYINNSTFKIIKATETSIRRNILDFEKLLDLKHEGFKFPYLFITVKFHKQPVKFRFVTCGTGSFNRKAGLMLFKKLKIILELIEKYEDSFIINNNVKVLQYLNNNNITHIDIYDFDNLFGSIPHDEILKVSKFYYKKYKTVLNCKQNYWLNLIKFCIFENIASDGSNFYKQIKGIPMGSSFSSAFANLFLHYYESMYTKLLNLKGFRYIDDMIIFDETNFAEIARDIYPRDLKLNRTNKNRTDLNFLDLKITFCELDNINIGIFDKRKQFDFEVIKLSAWSSNISKGVLRNIIINQLFRIKNICNNHTDKMIAFADLEEILKKNKWPIFFYRHLMSDFIYD